MSHSEVDVPSILKQDGIEYTDFEDINKEHHNIDTVINSMPKDRSWSKTLVNSDSNSVTLIAQRPGEGNRLHYHPEWNEWWYILRGRWEWEIEGVKKIISTGDFIFMKKGRKHKITACGDKELSIRMAVSRYDVEHIYPE